MEIERVECWKINVIWIIVVHGKPMLLTVWPVLISLKITIPGSNLQSWNLMRNYAFSQFQQLIFRMISCNIIMKPITFTPELLKPTHKLTSSNFPQKWGLDLRFQFETNYAEFHRTDVSIYSGTNCFTMQFRQRWLFKFSQWKEAPSKFGTIINSFQPRPHPLTRPQVIRMGARVSSIERARAGS